MIPSNKYEKICIKDLMSSSQITSEGQDPLSSVIFACQKNKHLRLCILPKD